MPSSLFLMQLLIWPITAPESAPHTHASSGDRESSYNHRWQGPGRRAVDFGVRLRQPVTQLLLAPQVFSAQRLVVREQVLGCSFRRGVLRQLPQSAFHSGSVEFAHERFTRETFVHSGSHSRPRESSRSARAPHTPRQPAQPLGSEIVHSRRQRRTSHSIERDASCYRSCLQNPTEHACRIGSQTQSGRRGNAAVPIHLLLRTGADATRCRSSTGSRQNERWRARRFLRPEVFLLELPSTVHDRRPR